MNEFNTIWQLVIPAFIMGLGGSLHCLGMCGPIAMALPLQGADTWKRLAGALSYNFGRISTYATLGLLFGLAGKSFSWFGWQQRISIGMGLVILVFLFLPRILPDRSANALVLKAMGSIRHLMAVHLFRNNPGSMYVTGLLNGLLPCGLVYMAVAGAVVSGDAFPGLIFMVFFGMGTLPAMLSGIFFGNLLKQPVRDVIRQAYPAILMIMAVLLILRGMNLGIPFVSPNLNISSSSPADCHPG